MHIRHIVLFSPVAEEHTRFYANVWGLNVVHQDKDASYLRGTGPEFYLLGLRTAAHKGIHHIAFAMDSQAQVNDAATRLKSRGVRLLYEPKTLDEPGAGYGLQFIDPDGRCIELSSGVATHQDGYEAKPVQPSSICHVVLNTPSIDRAADFYTDMLGFRISDWSEHQMVFLRCDSKHHAVSFNQAPHASLNHVAYLVSGVDDIMRGVSNLKKHGVDPSWGPGRHGPGNNIFCYFKDPAGYVTEYTSDIDYIRDEAAHQPKVWSRSPDAIDRWGLAGPPGPVVREAMAGEPDEGWAVRRT
jgi:catechol 2,3-dioxygenase-like lactoylglutathione lyase family enzyme